MIVASAIRKDGKVYTGHRHCDVLKAAQPFGYLRDGEQGFVTDTGEFVDRSQAWVIATACNQLIRVTGAEGTLYSEDLW